MDHILGLFFVLKGISMPFSIVAVPIYISINSVGGFPFLHILSHFHLFGIESFGMTFINIFTVNFQLFTVLASGVF